jgi:hypothetical protein
MDSGSTHRCRCGPLLRPPSRSPGVGLVKRGGVALAATVALLAVLGLGLFLGTRHSAVEAADAPTPLIGHQAPLFRDDPSTDAPFRWPPSAGRSWSSTSGRRGASPVRPRPPSCRASAWSTRNDAVAVLGVVFNDSVSSAASFERHYGSLYPSLAVDPQGSIASALRCDQSADHIRDRREGKAGRRTGGTDVGETATPTLWPA